MQDRYAGDIGDYGKFALLKAIEKMGLRVGINWYKNQTAYTEKQEDGKYLIPKECFYYDKDISEPLYDISKSKNRSISEIENAGILKTNIYYDMDIPPKFERRDWQKNAVEHFHQCDIVFLDPDNGLSIKSVGDRSAKSVKYVYIDEIADYIKNGISVVFYNHRQRLKADLYFHSIRNRLEANESIKGKHIFALTFPKCSVRDYFLIASSEKSAYSLNEAIVNLMSGSFGKSGFCIYQKSFFE